MERFSRYLHWATGDRVRAFQLYAHSTALWEALYTPLQMPEVALRNRFQHVLTAELSELWFDEPGLLEAFNQQELLADAKTSLALEGEDAIRGRIVAALTFGF